MPQSRPIVRLIHFDPTDYRLLCDLAKGSRLEGESLSTVLHWIIQEWSALRSQAEADSPGWRISTSLLKRLFSRGGNQTPPGAV